MNFPYRKPWLVLLTFWLLVRCPITDNNIYGIRGIWEAGVARQNTPQPQLIADPYVVIAKSIHDWQQGAFTGNPLLVKASSGCLLALFSGPKAGVSVLYKSDDGGESWQELTTLDVLPWPSMFTCASGLYILYPEIGYNTGDPENCLKIIRSDNNGTTWSLPVVIQATNGLAISTGNTGALASQGRVTYSFEVSPVLNEVKPITTLEQSETFTEQYIDQEKRWITVADPGFVPRYTLVAIREGATILHCRVMDTNTDSGQIRVRPERWKALDGYDHSPVNSPEDGPWTFSSGAMVEVASGTLGGNRDFWSMAIDAPDDPGINLCNSSIWRISNPVANPAYAFSEAMYETFGLVFDYRNPEGQPDSRGRWNGWLEGVLIRLEHEGGSGKILNLLRMAQNMTDSISGRVLFDDSGAELIAESGRLGFDEGLGVTHCYAEYDKISGLYWMVSNVNRNSLRDLTGIDLKGDTPTQERSNLALFYSRNAKDWFMVGMVAYSRDWAHSYHYPHFEIDDSDILVIARSHVESPLTDWTMNKEGNTADNHDGNAVTFHRVRDFRKLANMDFIRYSDRECWIGASREGIQQEGALIEPLTMKVLEQNDIPDTYNAIDISVGNGGYIYIVESGSGLIRRYYNKLFDGKVSRTSGGSALDGFISVDVGQDGFIYAARNGTGAMKFDVNLVHTGITSFYAGVDISASNDGFVYLARGDGLSIIRLDTNLVYTGIQSYSTSSGSVMVNMISVDVGTDGNIYACRTDGKALKFEAGTLAYNGVYSNMGLGVDVTQGHDGYVYMARGSDYSTIRLDADLQYIPQNYTVDDKGIQEIGFNSVDYYYHEYNPALVPEHCQDAILRSYRLTGDLNNDCFIDIYDISMLGKFWLECIDPLSDICSEPWN